MNDITQQAILALSASFRQAASEAVGNANYARFYDGRIIKMVADRTYMVAVGNSTPTLKVYGNTLFKPGQHCYVVSPTNDKDFAHMFILGVGTGSADGSNPDHELLNELIANVNNKVDKSDVVQGQGESTTLVMSQKAVSDAIAAAGGGVSGVLVAGTEILPDANRKVFIPVANSTAAGVVLSSTAANQVAVDTTGKMTVNSVDIMRVTQKQGDLVLLQGGDSTT